MNEIRLLAWSIIQLVSNSKSARENCEVMLWERYQSLDFSEFSQGQRKSS